VALLFMRILPHQRPQYEADGWVFAGASSFNDGRWAVLMVRGDRDDAPAGEEVGRVE
jgi:hypothetical protein